MRKKGKVRNCRTCHRSWSCSLLRLLRKIHDVLSPPLPSSQVSLPLLPCLSLRRCCLLFLVVTKPDPSCLSLRRCYTLFVTKPFLRAVITFRLGGTGGEGSEWVSVFAGHVGTCRMAVRFWREKMMGDWPLAGNIWGIVGLPTVPTRLQEYNVEAHRSASSLVLKSLLSCISVPAFIFNQ